MKVSEESSIEVKRVAAAPVEETEHQFLRRREVAQINRVHERITMPDALRKITRGEVLEIAAACFAEGAQAKADCVMLRVAEMELRKAELEEKYEELLERVHVLEGPRLRVVDGGGDGESVAR